ncbi:MAG: hypothetical protein RLZZ598_368 [Pseudomonadota bacterium]
MKNRIHQAAIALAVLLSGAAASAQSVKVSDPWVRATVAQQSATGAFMQLQSAKGARVLEVRSPVAALAEIHEMAMKGDMMQMRPVQALDLPAGKTVEFKPGGYHLMLMGLKQPLKAGDSVPLSLIVETADGRHETLEIKAPVRALGSTGQH